MENHPIPQDVTGFKFKIIGSMTIKQFGYVIAAGIFCTITFALPIEGLAALLKFPLILLFAAVGFALAFVPVGGRPLDKMLVYFATSIPKENQFVYHKQGVDLNQYEFFKPVKVTAQATQVAQQPKSNANRTALASALRNSYFRPDEEELQYFSSIKASFDNPATPVATPPMTSKVQLPSTPPLPSQAPVSSPPPTPVNVGAVPAPLPSVEPVTPVIKEREVINPVAPVQPTITTDEIKEKLAQAPEAATKTQQDTKKEEVAEIAKEIQDIKTAEQTAGKTEELENKIRDLEQKLAEALGQTAQYQNQVLNQAKQPTATNVVTPVEKQAAPAQSVKTVTAQTQLNSGFPTLPDIPNIILGIIKDPRGKVLQNILVEVVDSNELPVRAFKTNALGQFISATPLPNGTYKIYFDDPGKTHEFETVQVEMKGEIFNPIEVTSVDQREKLRRDLFGPMATPAPMAAPSV